MTTKKPNHKNRLVIGRDFDAWAFRYAAGNYSTESTSGCRPNWKPFDKRGNYVSGEWVRVRFVRVQT
jgi:hypothetical protein